MSAFGSRHLDFETLPESIDRTRSVDRLHQNENEQSRGSQPIQEVVDEGGDLSGYQLTRDRSRKEIKTHIHYAQADLIAYAFNVGDQLQHDEPATFEEACQSDKKDLWLTTMKEEMSSLIKNKT